MLNIMGFMVNGMDLVNGIFEIGGGLLVWGNVRRLWIDREVKGIDWRINGFFSSWSLWNLVFYSSVDCWLSVLGSGVLMLGNMSWVGLYVYLMWLNKK